MKIYKAEDLEIHDLSGKKTIEQLKAEFNKEEVVDITEEYNAKIEANKLVAKETSEKEAKIQKELRAMAEERIKAREK